MNAVQRDKEIKSKEENGKEGGAGLEHEGSELY